MYKNGALFYLRSAFNAYLLFYNCEFTEIFINFHSNLIKYPFNIIKIV